MKENLNSFEIRYKIFEMQNILIFIGRNSNVAGSTKGKK